MFLKRKQFEFKMFSFSIRLKTPFIFQLETLKSRLSIKMKEERGSLDLQTSEPNRVY